MKNCEIGSSTYGVHIFYKADFLRDPSKKKILKLMNESNYLCEIQKWAPQKICAQ